MSGVQWYEFTTCFGKTNPGKGNIAISPAIIWPILLGP